MEKFATKTVSFINSKKKKTDDSHENGSIDGHKTIPNH